MNRLFFFSTFILLCGCYSKQPVVSTGLEGKAMPAFSLLLPDSSSLLNTQSIPTGKPIVLCYFGTHCPYSRAEMQDIVKSIDELKNIRFYILTTDRFKQMKGFYTQFQLSKYDNITMGQDYSAFFSSYFQAKGVPYIAIYDKNKKLNRVFLGKTNIDAIKESTEN